MKYMRNCSPLILLFFLLINHASAVESLSYSGRLVNTNGSPVVGPVNLKIELAYTNAPAVTLCSQDFTNVPLSNGVFHLKLNFDCTPQTLQQVLSAIPANESAAVRVTDQTNSKAYAYQALHSVPFAYMSQTAMQLTSLGATNGQFLKWNNTTKKWEPGNAGAGDGSVTTINTGDGLTGGPITTTGTISIADGGVSDVKVATGISRSKLAAGSANHVVINNGAGALSSVAQLPIAQGGTGAGTAADARTSLGLGSASVANIGMGAGTVMASYGVPECLATEKLSMTLLPVNAWTCIPDNDSADATKLPLAGGQMSGDIDMNTNSITNLAAPTQLSDAATMGYVVNEVDALDNAKENKITASTNLSLREVRFSELTANGSNYVSLRSPDALASDFSFILPNSYGTSGQVLSTNGAGGVLSWVDVATTSTTVGGDVTGTISNIQLASGVVGSTEVQDGSLTNNDVASGANIDAAKMGTGIVSNTELNYLDGLTSSIQTQLNGKLSSTLPTCGAGEVLKSDGTSFSCVTDDTGPGAFTGPADRVVLTDGSGNLAVSAVTNTEVGYLTGVTGAIQTQINAKQATLTSVSDLLGDQLRIYNGANYVEVRSPALGGNVVLTLPTTDGDANQVLQTDGNGNLTWVNQSTFSIADGSVTYAKLNLADGDIPQAKVSGLVSDLAGKEPAIAAGTTAQYIRGDKSLSTFATDAINSALAGFVTGANSSITSSDTVLSAFEKTQGQINAKLNSSSFVDWSVVGVQTLEPSRLNLGLSNRVVVTNGSGAVAVSSITATELGHLSGATSNIQTQLNSKLSSYTETDPNVSAFAKAALPTCGAGEVLKSDGTNFSCVTDNSGAGAFTGTANRVVLTDGAGDLAVSAVTNTEVGYLTGVTSAIQTQLNAKQGTLTSTTDLLGDQLRIYNGANYVEVRSPALGGNVVLTLPNNDGSANEVLQTDGNGNLSWASFPSAPVISVNTQTGAVTLTTSDVAEGTNQYFTGSRVLSTVLTGLSTAANAAIAATDSVLVAFGKLQAQISGQSTSISGKADQTNIAQTITAATVTGLTAPVAGSDAANKTYVDGQITGAANQWTAGSGNVYRSTGSVGIGTASPQAILDVADQTWIRSSVGGALPAAAGKGIKLYYSSTFDLGGIQAYDYAGATAKNLILNQSGGNIGIGTTTPAYKLDVNGAINATAISINGVAVGTGGTQWANGGSGVISYTGGNVGIGTTSPAYPLSVQANVAAFSSAISANNASAAAANVGPAISFFGEAGSATHMGFIGTQWNSSANTDTFFTIGTRGSGTVTEKMRVSSTGNVGIGTTAPGSALDVKGTLRLSGATSGYVGLAPAAAAGSTTYTLPSADGTNGQVLSTNGSGVMSWISPAGSVSSVFGRSGAVVATSGDYNASQVTNTAAGNIAATNVQTAINELDTEKQNVSTFAADVRAVALSGLSTATNAVISATDSVIVAVGKLQAQISGQATSISGKADQTNIAQTITAATVTGLTAPVAGSDATNKTYVDGQITGAANQWTAGSGNVYRSTGSVGIGTGTIAANTKLSVVGGRTMLQANSETYALGLQYANGLGQYYVGATNSLTPDLVFSQVGGAERMRVTDSGNVGIGTTNPRRRLSINGGGLAFQEPAGSSRSIHWGDETTDIFPILISGNSTSGAETLTFGTNTFGNPALERMRIDSAGNVGIGTSSPAYKLDVNGAINATSILINGVAVGTGGTQWANGGGGAISYSGGNVGVGTTSPGAELHVAKDTDATLRISAASNTASAAGYLNLEHYRGTHGSPSANSAGDALGNINFVGYTDSRSTAASIRAIADTGWSSASSDSPGALLFQTTPDGSSSLVERMRINSAGNIGVGTTTPGSKLDVKGTLRLSGATSGYVGFAPAAAAGLTTYTLPSADGTNGQVLSTNGAGVMSWISPVGSVSSVFGRSGAVVATSGDYTATQVTNTAAGNIAATNVQTAINELDTEKQNVSTFAADVRAVVLTGLSTATNAAIAATDSVLDAFGKLQAQISGQATSISGKADQTNIAQTITAATVTGLTAPVAGSDAANKTYVDGQVAGAANQWSESSGNVYRSTGNVGIGEANPTAKLQVAGTVYNASTTGFAIGSSGPTNQTFKVTGMSGQFAYVGAFSDMDVGQAYDIKLGGTSKGILARGQSSFMSKVGIGTTTPAYKLDILGTGTEDGVKVTLDTNTANNAFVSYGGANTIHNMYHGATDEALYAQSYNGTTTNLIRAQGNSYFNGGNVGIGTTAPASKLEVSGSVRIQDQLLFQRTTGSVFIPAMMFSDTLGGARSDNLSLGNGGGGDLLLHTNGSERMRVLGSNGNIGIGTATPSAKLQVNGAVAGKSAVFTDATNSTGFSSHPSAGVFGFGGDAGSAFALFSNNTEKVRIDSAGNVGIGTSSPERKLHVKTAGANSAGLLIEHDSSGTGSGRILLVDTNGGSVTTSPTWGIDNVTDVFRLYRQPNISTGGSVMMTVLNTGNVGFGTTIPRTKTHSYGTSIAAFTGSSNGVVRVDAPYVNGQWHALDFSHSGDPLPFARIATQHTGGGTYMSFGTSNNFSSGVTNQAMTINPAGAVGIGTAAPDERFVVFNGTTTGKYTTSGWTHSSDARLKHDISPIENSLEKILKMNGVEYIFNSDPENKKQIGFIAQEVEPLFPEVVITDEKGFKSMNYANLVAPLVEATKTLYKRLVATEGQQVIQSRQIASKVDKKELEELKVANLKKDQKIKELEERLARIEKVIQRK